MILGDDADTFSVEAAWLQPDPEPWAGLRPSLVGLPGGREFGDV